MVGVDQTPLSHDEGLELLRALVHRIAVDEGFRMLSIKGPVTEMHGLRPPRRYNDVDVWVEPAGLGEVIARLVGLGWVTDEAVASVAPRLLDLHSMTLVHPNWPVELDVHDRFPGFLAAPDDVFEALWDDRSALAVAGVTVPATGLAGSLLVSALHAAREDKGIDHTAEVAAVAEQATTLAASGRSAALAALAEVTGATHSAAAVLAAAGVAPAGLPADRAALRRWELRSHSRDVLGLAWMDLLRGTPLWRWPAVVLRALLSSEVDLRLNWPEAPSGRRGLWVARWLRLRKGLPHIPRAIALVWRSRRRQ